MTHSVLAPWARIEGQWQKNVLLSWDEHGRLTDIHANYQSVPGSSLHQLPGAVLPGMPNLHSHAFQSAMSGLAEYRGQAQDSFWSWRDLMYRFALKLRPEHIQAIAHWLYIQMLKAGYTSVCEFHYVHHQPDGQAYTPQHTLAAAVVQASQDAGIGLSFLPVLYQYSDFGAQPPRQDQARFLNQPEALLELLLTLRQQYPEQAHRRYGVAPHSLRAVSPDSLRTMLTLMDEHFPHSPIHIHIAEQVAEVQASLNHHGQRPVQWLLDNASVDRRWCLVHATHMDEQETVQAAASGAVAGLCLSTEANLGDGFFPAPHYLKAGGAIGVGSDSHIAVDWRTELRLLEYGQRLLHRQRNVLCHPAQAHVADYLFDASIKGGAQASARPVHGLQIGQQADFMVLDLHDPILAGHKPETWLSALVFTERAGSQPIRDVYVAGQAVIQEGRHAQEDQAWQRYQHTLHELLQTT